MNIVKTIISKMVYNKQISDLKEKEEQFKEKIADSKEKAASLKDKLKDKKETVSRDAKDAKKFLKDFIKQRLSSRKSTALLQLKDGNK